MNRRAVLFLVEAILWGWSQSWSRRGVSAQLTAKGPEDSRSLVRLEVEGCRPKSLRADFVRPAIDRRARLVYPAVDLVEARFRLRLRPGPHGGRRRVAQARRRGEDGGGVGMSAGRQSGFRHYKAKH